MHRLPCGDLALPPGKKSNIGVKVTSDSKMRPFFPAPKLAHMTSNLRVQTLSTTRDRPGRLCASPSVQTMGAMRGVSQNLLALPPCLGRELSRVQEPEVFRFARLTRAFEPARRVSDQLSMKLSEVRNCISAPTPVYHCR